MKGTNRQTDNMDYEYKDQQFSVEIAETLIPERWSHGNQTRSVTDRVMKSHIERGGLEPPEGENSRVMVKKALQKLSAVAKASEISKNVWRYGHTDQWIFGTGKHWVYLYYFPEDKKNAESEGKSIWQCRIGKADGVNKKNGSINYDAPDKRVENQTRSYRQKANTALLIRADRHVALETAIQKILFVQEREVRRAQGNSWFWTNPREVVKIVAEIHFDLLRPAYNVSAILADME